MEVYVWICIAVFVTGLIRGLSGFAAALIGLPLLVFFLDIRTVVPLVTLLGASSTIMLLFQLWKHLEWKEVYPLVIGFLPGIVIGVFFLKTLDKRILQMLLGIVLSSYSLYSLLFKLSKTEMRKRWAYLFGFFAGNLRGAIGAGGPAIVIYTSMQPWNRNKVKVTIQGFFIVSAVITVFVHASAGLITATVLKCFLVSLPALALGTLTGSYLYGFVKEETYRKIIFILLAILGLMTIYKAL